MWYRKTAAEIMETHPKMVCKKSSLFELFAVFSDSDSMNEEDYIAVVESLEDPVLVGSFKVRHAIDYLSHKCEIIEAKLTKSGSNPNSSSNHPINPIHSLKEQFEAKVTYLQVRSWEPQERRQSSSSTQR
jgi:hypothetical protein